jgi:hypothetical protein
MRDEINFDKLVLRHTYFVCNDGSRSSATEVVAKIIGGAKGSVRWSAFLSSIAQHRFYRMQKLGLGERRYSSAPDPDSPEPDGQAPGNLELGDQQEKFLETILVEEHGRTSVDTK